MYYRVKLLNKIMALEPLRMTTREIVEAVGASKQGFVSMMARLEIQPVEVLKGRGQFGTYIWDMKQVKRVLNNELKLMFAAKETGK